MLCSIIISIDKIILNSSPLNFQGIFLRLTLQYLQHFSFNIFLSPPLYHTFHSGVPSLSQFYLTNKTPYHVNNSRIEYFVIFKSFSGLMNYRVDFNEETKVVLKDLPVGEPVTLIAFTKSKGIIYEGKKDFIIGKNKKIAVDFKIISQKELSKIFRNNVKA